MKKLFKLIFPLLLAITTVGCTQKAPSEKTSEKEPEQSESVPVESESVDESEEESEPSESEPATSEEESEQEYIDYVHGDTVRLGLDYKGHDFYQDGIGEVTLRTAIDGDTAHFDPVITDTSVLAIKARFFGIDTPESTGRIEEYGKDASDFTREKLENAAANGTIVVSTAQDDYGAPKHDSTGERYVSLVWINETEKNASYDSLILLNLWIVQEGLSWVKNVSDMPQYRDTFYAAESQARRLGLKLFSGEPDPRYPHGDFVVTTLLELKIETENILKDPNYESVYDNTKVSVCGTVAGFSNQTLYLQDYFSEENGGRNGGEYAAINCYCGPSSVPSMFTRIGTYLRVSGFAINSKNFGFQITGLEGHFVTVSSVRKDDDVEVLLKASENVDEHALKYLEYSSQELSTITSQKTFECLNCAVRITDVLTVSSFYINDAGTEITLRFTGCNFSAYITFPYKGNPDRPQYIWKTEEDFLNKQFTAQGVYTYHKAQSGNISYQIIFNNASDFVCVSL